MSTRENDLIRELTVGELDIVAGGKDNLHLADIAKAAAKAGQNAGGGFDFVFQQYRDLYSDRY
jgi:hypothetical protein